MDYKDLLERYKKGSVTEEEKKFIEEEIQKHEAIEDYRVENFDDEFETMDNSSNLSEHKEETAKLKKSVNTRLRKNILKSVIIVILLYVGIFYGLSSVVDAMYFDPTAKTQSVKKEFQNPDFYYDMQAYVSLNLPGSKTGFFTTQESKGFGKYDLSYSLENQFSGEEQRYFATLNRGLLVSDNPMGGISSNRNLFGVWDGFDEVIYHLYEENNGATDEFWDTFLPLRNQETVDILEELNPLSYVSMSIIFDEDLSMEEFYGGLKREYPMVDFSWVGVRTVEPGYNWSEDKPMFLVGFNPDIQLSLSRSEKQELPKYPLFDLGVFEVENNLNEDQLHKSVANAYETHFKSRLKYIHDQKEFVEIFDYSYIKNEFYEKSLTYVEENGVKTYGVLAYATAGNFLEHIDEFPYKSIYINEVLPTSPKLYQ